MVGIEARILLNLWKAILHPQLVQPGESPCNCTHVDTPSQTVPKAEYLSTLLQRFMKIILLHRN